MCLTAVPAAAQEPDPLAVAPYPAEECPACAGWNEPTEPFRVHGNTWWVGTRGLAALLVTSPEGHVLVDAGLPESAAHIAASVRSLGFDPADVTLIVHSHPHYDHAGGIEPLRALSGARVVATPPSAAVLRAGHLLPGDPQHGVDLPFPAVAPVEEIAWGDTLRVGGVALVAHPAPGHTPGGTTWSWRSCEDGACLEVVYADSATPVSAEGFRFSGDPAWPDAEAAFRRGIATLRSLPCHLLITPHPGASDFWPRVREGRLVDPGACRAYADRAEEALEARLRREAGGNL